MDTLSLIDIPEDVLDEILPGLHRVDRFLLSITCKSLRARYLLKYADEYYPSEMLCYDAALLGHTDLFKWAMTADYARPVDDVREKRNIIDAAAKSGSVPTVELVRGYGYVWTENTFYSGVKSGDISMLEWLRWEDCEIHITAYLAAVRMERLDILKWLSNYSNQTPTGYVCEIAAIRGRTDILAWWKDGVEQPFPSDIMRWVQDVGTANWLLKNGANLTQESIIAAIKDGNLKLAEWMDKHGCPYYATHAANTAARNGHLSILQWLYQKNTILPEGICTNAAKSGNLCMIKWLHDRGYVMTAISCSAAVLKGHTNIADWAIANGCEWTHTDTYYAANDGDIPVLKWAHSLGLIGCANVYGNANNRIDVIRWAISAGYPCDSNVYIYTASRGMIDVVKEYHAAGIPLSASVMSAAATSGNVELIEWLDSVGCPRNYNVYINAANHNKLNVIKYAWAGKWPYNDAAYNSCPSGHTGVCRWIEDNIHPAIGRVHVGH